jgi:hypothetical protein
MILWQELKKKIFITKATKFCDAKYNDFKRITKLLRIDINLSSLIQICVHARSFNQKSIAVCKSSKNFNTKVFFLKNSLFNE